MGCHCERVRKRAEEMLARLGLEKRGSYQPYCLSRGQWKRVAIARALVHRPRLILAEEPTVDLDEASSRDVVTFFQHVTREQRCTILVATHDNRILDVADRLVSMVDGRIRSDVLLKVSIEIIAFLRRVPLFQHLTPRTLAEVADQMKLEKHPAGTRIIAQGAEGDKFYLIRRGTVEVRRDIKGESRHLARLGEGAFLRRIGPGDRRAPQRQRHRLRARRSLHAGQGALPGADQGQRRVRGRNPQSDLRAAVGVVPCRQQVK